MAVKDSILNTVVVDREDFKNYMSTEPWMAPKLIFDGPIMAVGLVPWWLQLATMTIGSVRVRTAVDRAAGVRHRLLRSSSRQEAQDGRDHAQHQDQASYADPDGEASLRNANAVLRSLKNQQQWAPAERDVKANDAIIGRNGRPNNAVFTRYVARNN
jgi:hypothetical protein